MAGIDNSVFLNILLNLSPRDKTQGEIAEDLLAFSSGLQTALRKGQGTNNDDILRNLSKVTSNEETLIKTICKESNKKTSNTVYWPDLLGNPNTEDKWRSDTNTSYNNKERSAFRQLKDKNLDSQPFSPPTYANDYCFSSVAYDVFIDYMEKYASQHGEAETVSIIRSCLEDLYVPPSLIDDFNKQTSFKEIANFTINSIKKAQMRADCELASSEYNPLSQVVLRDWFIKHPDKIPPEYQRISSAKEDPQAFTNNQDNNKRPNRNIKKLLIAAASIILIFSVVIWAINRPPSPVPTELEDAEVVSPPVEETDDFYKVTLSASDETSVKDFNQASDAVKARLDILCAGEEYVFEKSDVDVNINLEIPKKVFENNTPEDVIDALICRPVQLYLYNKSDPRSQHMIIERDDIESLSIHNGSIEGFSEENASYVKLCLTGKYLERFVAEAAVWFGPDADLSFTEIGLAHDITEDFWFKAKTFMDTDGAIYIEPLPGCLELMQHVYSEDPIAVSFSCIIQLDTVYEDVGNALFPGKFQCNEGQLSGDTVELLLGGLSDYSPSSSTWFGSELGLKARLDAIGQPYNFGKISWEDRTYGVVQMDPAYMGPPVLQLLGADTYDFTFVCNSQVIDCGYDVQTEIIDPDNSIAYKMTVSADITPQEREVLASGNEIRLCVNGLPLLVSSSFTNDEITFSSLYFNNHQPLDSSNVWILQLIDEAINGEEYVSFYPMDFEFSPKSEQQIAFGIGYEEDKQRIKENLIDIIPDAGIYISELDPGNVQLYLHFYVDEDLPESAINTVEAIYKASGFEESCYTQLSIYLIDEVNEDLERARVFFKKSISPYSQGIEYHYIFSGGRLDKYSAGFEEIISSSEFFSNIPLMQ